MPLLKTWLSPRFRKDWMRRLRPGVYRDICWDDSEWSDILDKSLRGGFDRCAEELADSLEYAVLRTFHGCRTDNAGTYFREGLRLHQRDEMTARLRAIVDQNRELQWMRGQLAAAIQEIDNSQDEGRLYVVADDTCLLQRAAHYLIYGSEWIAAVLSTPGRSALKTIGAPTLLEIDLPLSMSSFQTRTELAVRLLNEWTRFSCNKPDWSAPIDFSFCIQSNIPSSCIVGHSHPAELHDPWNNREVYRSHVTTCGCCRP